MTPLAEDQVMSKDERVVLTSTFQKEHTTEDGRKAAFKKPQDCWEAAVNIQKSRNFGPEEGKKMSLIWPRDQLWTNLRKKLGVY